MPRIGTFYQNHLKRKMFNKILFLYTIALIILFVTVAFTGGEAAAYNTRDYQIQVSNDGSTWTDMVSVTGNTMGETKDAISLTKARYVKLTIVKATQGGDTAARIYEFEVNGLE